MRIFEVEKKAKTLGIVDTGSYTKFELIKKIQRAEGNFDCFGSAKEYCDQNNCLWRQDCLIAKNQQN